MNTVRLQQLIDLLREVGDGTWRATVMPPLEDDSITYSAEEFPSDLTEVFVEWHLSAFIDTHGPPKDCGFVACALGHACLDKRFVNQGLKFNEESRVIFELPVEDDKPEVLEYFEAAAFFFDIPEIVAEWLFSPGDDYNQAEDVIERLELYIRGEVSPDEEEEDEA